MLIDHKYEVIKKLGQGSQGEVFLVKSIMGNADLLALKTIKQTSGSIKYQTEVASFFVNEFKLMKNFKHPQVVKVFDFGFSEESSSYYYTMEYIDGLNLFDFIKSGKLDNFQFLDLIYKILCGLSYLHANNIVHYDIKPENILIRNSNGSLEVKLADFGLASLGKLQDRKIRGTINYMAPELFIPNEQTTPKIDLYSLGASLLFAVTKQKPVATSLNISGLLNRTNAIIEANILLLSEISDLKLRSFLEKMIAADPALRIGSAYQAIVLLNDLFQTEFTLPEIWALSSCEDNSRFLGRRDLYKKVYELAGKENVLLYGTSGCGLTKIMQRLNYQLSVSLATVVYFDQQDLQNQPVDKLYLALTGIHQKQLSKDFPLIETGTNLDSLKIMIKHISSNKILYLLIDDFQFSDNSFAEMINSLVAEADLNCRIVLAYKSESTGKSKDLKLELLLREANLSGFELEELDQHQIKEVVNGLLGDIVNLPDDFYVDLSKFTGGNFRQLMILLDSLIKAKIISSYQNLFIFSDPDKRFAYALKSLRHTAVKLPVQLNPVLQVLLFAPFGLPIDALIAYSGLEILYLQKFLELMTRRAVLKIRVINNLKYYYLTQSADYLRLVHKSNYRLETILALVYPETEKIIKFRSPAEQFYLNILKILAGSDEEIYNLWIEVENNNEIRVRLFYLTLSVEIISNPVLKVKLLAQTVKQCKSGQKSEITVNYLKKMQSIIRKNGLQTQKWLVVYLKLFLHDDVKFLVKPRYFLTNYKQIIDKLPAKEFVTLTIRVLESFLQSRHLDETRKIVIIAQNLIEKNPGELRFSGYLLKSYQIFYNLLEWQDVYLDQVEEFLDDFTLSGVWDDSYFKTLYSYISYFTLFKNRSSDTRFLKYLEKGLDCARNTKNYEFLLILSNHLGLYYRNTSQYPAAIKVYENILKHDNLAGSFNRSNVFNNLALIKYDTKQPVSEVVYLFSEACREQRKYSSLSSYAIQLSNISVMSGESGNFIESSRYLFEAFKYFDYLGSIYQKSLLSILPSHSACFMPKDQFLTQVKSLYSNDIAKVISRVEVCYDYVLNNNIESFYPADWFVMDGVLRNETLEIVLYLTLKTKKMPAKKLIFNSQSTDIGSKDQPESRLVYLMLKYLYEPSDDLSSKILKLLQKIQLSGYNWLLCLYLVRFLLFTLILKIELKDSHFFYNLLRENYDYVTNHCTAEQKIHFEQIYYAKAIRKVLKKHTETLRPVRPI